MNIKDMYLHGGSNIVKNITFSIPSSGTNSGKLVATITWAKEGAEPTTTAIPINTSIFGSVTKNTVLAGPNGSNGNPSFRALVAADIPDLAASKIASGVFDAARLPLASNSAKGAIILGIALTSDLDNAITGKKYWVKMNANGKLFVDIPWTDHTYTVNNATFSIKSKIGTNDAVTLSDFTANLSAADDFTLILGSNITFTNDTTNRTLTIAGTPNTTYKLTLNGTVKGTTGGTDLGTFYAIATSDTSTANQVWMRNSSNNGYGWRTLGSRAFDSTAYVPTSGGTILHNDFAPFFIQRNHTTNAAAMGFKHYSSGTTVEVMGYIGMSEKDGALKRWDGAASTAYIILDSGNSSVSKSGETLTVKINGTTQSLTNTWRGIQNNLTSDSTTDSLSAALGKILDGKFGNYVPKIAGTGSVVAHQKSVLEWEGCKIVIPGGFNSWMIAFTVRVYIGYLYTDIVFSGYHFGGKHWHSPEARVIGGSKNYKVVMGYEGDNLYVWLGETNGTKLNYGGITVMNLHAGHIDIPDWYTTWSISNVAYADLVNKQVDTTTVLPSMEGHTHTWSSITSKPAALGSATLPVYWNGSGFTLANAYPTKSSWNYDDVYVKKVGSVMTGNLYLKGSANLVTNSTGGYANGIRVNRAGFDKWAGITIGYVSANLESGASGYDANTWMIATPANSNYLNISVNGNTGTNVGLTLKGSGTNDIIWNNNIVYHAGNIPSNSASAKGVVPAGVASSVYMTDASKNPSWTSIDTTVTSGSSHLVTSGAVYTAIANNVASAVQYQGTITSEADMIALTDAGKGDFARVTTEFTFTDASGASVKAHVGDVVYLTNDTPGTAANWIVAHTEIDTNTWTAASTSAAGYVPKLATGGANLAAASTDYVLAFTNGATSPSWLKLPANAYKDTWIAWKGATSSAAGTAGYMPGAAVADRTKFLRGDGSWIALSLTDHTHSVKINGSTKTIAATGGTAVDLGSYLPLAGGTMVGTISATNDSQSGGGFHNSYANIILRGNTTTGTSGIIFSSSKGDTAINRPSDCAFIQFHPYGVTVSKNNVNPTIGTSGESNKLIIGVNNDGTTDLVWLLTPGADGLRHIVCTTSGTNNYIIADAGNISNKAAVIGTTATTLATIAGVNITASLPTAARGESAVTSGVITPTSSGTTKFLREDGTWQTPSYTTNTDKTGIKLATVSGTKKIDGTVIITNSSTGLSIAGGTNKFSIGDGTNYIEVAVTPSITNNVTGSGTSGKLVKWSGTNAITDGPALSSAISSLSLTTKFLREDGTWAAPSYTTDTVRPIYSGGTSRFTSSLKTAINFVGAGATSVTFLAEGTGEGQSGNASYASIKISSNNDLVKFSAITASTEYYLPVRVKNTTDTAQLLYRTSIIVKDSTITATLSGNATTATDLKETNMRGWLYQNGDASTNGIGVGTRATTGDNSIGIPIIHHTSSSNDTYVLMKTLFRKTLADSVAASSIYIGDSIRSNKFACVKSKNSTTDDWNGSSTSGSSGSGSTTTYTAGDGISINSGVISTTRKEWYGTEAQFNALTSLDSNTTYYITAT